MSHYFSWTPQMGKAELRCLGDMTLGILKSKSVFVNQIVASLREPLRLKDVARRLSAQYPKEGIGEKVLEGHLGKDGTEISKNGFILMDETDIGKKHAKYMEGLEFVGNGDTGEIGLDYNYLNKNVPRELVNFIYYKLGKVVSNLLTPREGKMEITK